MKHGLFTLVVILQFSLVPIFGQIKLSTMEIGSTDSIQKSSIRYFSPGKGGNKKVWDFSKKLVSKESTQVMFMKDSTGLLSIIEPGTIKYYQSKSNTLFLTGSETPLEKREYVNNKLFNKFPLEYCDSINDEFMCEGMYCGNHPFREIGTTYSKVDAEGSIILAENDTIRNVRRVHTINSYSVCMDLDVAALDTAKLTQVIDERYEWYLPDSEYPIIENVTSTAYSDMEAIGTTRYACCNLTEEKVASYITPDDEDVPDDLDNSFDEEMTEPDIIHYTIGINGGTININYDLDADATISTIIASHTGITYRHKEWTQNAGQCYSAQMDCNGLSAGLYILYINVNGKVYSEKVTL